MLQMQLEGREGREAFLAEDGDWAFDTVNSNEGYNPFY
jgi:hypothetical protein